jgi:hypothetical protein
MDNYIRNQIRIYNTLKSLEQLPKTTVTKEVKDNSTNTIWIWHEQEYFPGFEFRWCPIKQHYRIYIWVASTEHEKENAGYCICTVSNGFSAMGFGVLYGFLHKHRANNKEAAK